MTELRDKIKARELAAADYRAMAGGLRPKSEAFNAAGSMAKFIDSNIERYVPLAISERRRK